MRTTFKGELVAYRKEMYSSYVFKNLDEPNNSLMRYITVTILPNWTTILPEIGDAGFVECEYVNQGDSFIRRSTGEKDTYLYTACYFINFIKEQPKIKNKEYKF